MCRACRDGPLTYRYLRHALGHVMQREGHCGDDIGDGRIGGDDGVAAILPVMGFFLF